jgi:two-component sensor histidine kinase
MYGIVRKMTLRQRLVALVAVAMVPGLIALLIFIAAFHRERQREVRDQAIRTSEILALEIDRIVSGAGSVLETLAFAPAVRTLSPACPAYLGELVARLPQFSGFAVAETDGRVRCATSALADGRFAVQPFFREAAGGIAVVVGGYTSGQGRSPPMLPVALRIDDGSGTPRVLVTGIDLSWLDARVRERNLSLGSALTIADRNGTVLAREPEPERFVGTRLSDTGMGLLAAGRPGTVDNVSPDGTRRIVGYQPPAATGSGLYVGAGYSTDLAFAPVYRSTWWSLAMSAAGAAAAFFLAWTVGERLFRRPIRRIVDTVASWRAGDESARIGIAPDAGELSILAAAIDEYMDGLVAVRAERRAAEERRTLLLREMNHRIKNILAAVQAIANQTFRDGASSASLRAFGDRLAAMAATHDLLVTESWESADLGETVTAALAPFGPERKQRFTVKGPQVQVTANAALALSMALHELCTNAAKYGALATDTGTVAVRWHLSGSADKRRFHFSWRERGGPPVTKPDRRGFGSRLIEAALASELSACAELRFPEEGVEFVLDADAAEVIAPREPAAA